MIIFNISVRSHRSVRFAYCKKLKWVTTIDVNTGRILPWFGRKLQILEKLECDSFKSHFGSFFLCYQLFLLIDLWSQFIFLHSYHWLVFWGTFDITHIITTYIALNFLVPVFLAKMRWFPDNLMVLFLVVLIDLYVPITECCLFRNDLTSLYITLSVEETKS